jgi:hypothetical protein
MTALFVRHVLADDEDQRNDVRSNVEAAGVATSLPADRRSLGLWHSARLFYACLSVSSMSIILPSPPSRKGKQLNDTDKVPFS